MRINDENTLVLVLRKYFVLSSIITFLVLLGCGHADEDAQVDGGQSDTDSDTDTDADTDQDSLDMNCEGGYLFEYGIETAAWNDLGQDGWYTSGLYEFEYDSEKKPIGAYVQFFDESGALISSYERNYFYDEEGRLDRMEWVQHYEDGTEDQAVERRFTYDEQGRTLSEENFREADGKMLPTYSQWWEYGEDGKVTRSFTDGQDSTVGYDYGYSYEYDEVGRKTKSIRLDSENDWAETEEFSEYQYDSEGRVLKTVNWTSDYYTGDLDDTEWDYLYYGDTARLSEFESSDGLKTTFEWDGNSLTITYEGDYYFQQWVHTYTEEGSSFYWEIYPMPPTEWARSEYGNGYINGCIGQ